LYALDKSDKHLLWKRSNGSSVVNYSPAACIPVVKDYIVYVVAPEFQMVYGKIMQGTVVAFYTNKEKPELAWKMNVGFGYEHTPSMLIEKNRKLYFGTKNEVVYCINPSRKKLCGLIKSEIPW
jgi:outer membrane protein assembly factor BamB